MPWSFTSPPIGYGHPNRKHVSQLRIRIELAEGAEVTEVALSFDGGEWVQKNVQVRFTDGGGRGTGTILVPVRPSRYETLRYRVSGVGAYKLTGVTIVTEESGK